jgi:hypothetical protein
VDVHDVDEMIRSIVATQTGRTITKQVAADGEGVMPPTGR